MVDVYCGFNLSTFQGTESLVKRFDEVKTASGSSMTDRQLVLEDDHVRKIVLD